MEGIQASLFIKANASSPVLGSSQPPTQLPSLKWQVDAADPTHFHLVPRLRMSGYTHPLSQTFLTTS